jgi:hypothetical protein
MRVALLVIVAACGSSSERVYALEELPVREWTLGLPVYGDGKLTVSKSLLDVADWSKANGHVRFDCEDCTLGNDRAPMQLGEPIGDVPFTSLTVDEVSATADFANGRMHLTSRWRSEDFELDARVDATLAKVAADAQLAGCVKFRPTEALRERDPKMHALISTTGAGQDGAGWFTIAIDGTLGEMKRRASACEL